MTQPRLPQGETQALLNRTVDLFLPAASGSEALLAEEVQRQAQVHYNSLHGNQHHKSSS